MSLFSILNILLITEFCQSFKPNNGRYFSRIINTEPSTNQNPNERAEGSNIFGRRIFPERNNNTTNYTRGAVSKSNSDITNKTPREVTLTYLPRNASSYPSRTYASRITSTPTNTLPDRDYKTTKQKVQKHVEYNNSPLSGTHRYKPGSISDTLSRYRSSQVSSNNNPESSYRTLLEYANIPPANVESITATSLLSEIYHPTGSLNIQNYSSPNDALKTRNDSTPVRSASLNSEIYHRPHAYEYPNTRTSIDTIDRLLMRPIIDGILYNQSIVHINEPKYLPTPLLTQRKQRNLRQVSVDKLIEHEEDEEDDDDNVGQDENEEGDADAGDRHETQSQDDAQDDDDRDGANDEDSGADAVTAAERVADDDAASPSSEQAPLAKHEMRYLHDIFLNYPKPHHVNYGHVQLTPELFEKRFETTKEGNRYKGEVLWMDNNGGYAQHHWNLALGKL